MPPPLDKSLFTLTIDESKEEAGATDLFDSNGEPLYRRRWGDSKEGSYAVNIFDPLSDSLLATVTAPNATSKNKLIELHNPTIKVELNFTGRLSFKWNFTWEEHEFEWKKEECYLLRKPDPPVLVAVTEPEKKNKKAMVQFLDYNLTRFDINDRRGLEVLLVASLLSFQDQSDEYRTRAAAAEATSGGLRAYSRQSSTGGASAPALPPKPGEAMVVKLQSSHKHEPNEIVVGSEGAVDEYVDLACNLLQDENMMFIMIRALDSAQVQRVVQVAEETKRTRRRARYEEELHQYLRYEDEPEKAPKGPKVIKLDESPSKDTSIKGYSPPKTLTIHLSKIPMPELMPVAPPPKPANLQKTLTVIPPPPGSSSTRRPSPKENPPSGHRSSFIGSLSIGGGGGKGSSGLLNAPQPPRPGGVATQNPYNPYGRRSRPVSPTLENATPPPPVPGKLQKPKQGRRPSDGVSPASVPYSEPHYGAPPGAYPQNPPQWGPAPGPAPAPPSMQGQPSTIQDFMKDGVASLGSSLLGRFSTRK